VAGASLANGITGRNKRRKKDGDTASVTGASVKGGKAGSATGASALDAEGNEEEEEDNDVEGEAGDTVLEGGKLDDASEKQEMEHRR
jgi:transcription initiation factor TFIID subunit 11